MNVGSGLAPASATALSDVLHEYGGRWQIEAAEFCYVAVRRPTPTMQEIVTGRDLGELARKLAAEEAASDG
jgi:hypothetical protein